MFVLLVTIAAFAVLVVLGSHHWFFRDDFEFITSRSATSLDDLFRPFAGHWTTVPLVAFRGLWSVFGLRSYVPYQASVLALHLGACVLLRVIMRRVGVGAWVATAVAASFLLFGPGEKHHLGVPDRGHRLVDVRPGPARALRARCGSSRPVGRS